MKTYKLYDLHSHVVFQSYDVVFHENVFPFYFSPFPNVISSSSCPLPLPIHHNPSSSFASFPCSPSHSLIPFSSLSSYPSSLSSLLASPFSIPLTTRTCRSPVWLQAFFPIAPSHLFLILSPPSFPTLFMLLPHHPPTFPYIQPSYFSPSYLHFLGLVSSLLELTSYAQDSSFPEWCHAMLQELHVGFLRWQQLPKHWKIPKK